MIRRFITRKFVIASAVFVLTGLSAAAYFANRSGTEVKISTLPVTRGDVVETVSATGTLEALKTVQVGAEVSGSIQALYADFNSIVRRGQLLARLDPMLLESQVAQAQATVVRSEAEVERLQVSLADSDMKLQRTRALADKRIAAMADLETAEVTRRVAETQVKSAEAQLLQARAVLNQAVVNREKTAIASPIDGIIVSRNVDIGQTVAASMQAPTLFLIAADLTRMRVNASVDESDVGRIQPGQRVRFRVDAFPSEEFTGTVAQVRLSPTVQQNVVTYQTLIDVPNLELKLRPGMTANVTVETRRRDNVLRASNAALRFRPTAETFALLGQVVPGVDSKPGTAAPARTGNGSGISVVNARFAAEAAVGTSGRVWLMVDGTLTAVEVRLGANDGTYTELLNSTLAEGAEVVSGVTSNGTTTKSTATPSTTNPFLGTQPRMPMGPPPGGPPPAGTRPGQTQVGLMPVRRRRGRRRRLSQKLHSRRPG
jgi:HlyD family secretion protein